MLIVSAFHFPNLGFQVVFEFGQVFEQRVDERVVDRGGIVTKIPRDFPQQVIVGISRGVTQYVQLFIEQVDHPRDIGAFERNRVENISQAAPPWPPGR